jgi:aspartate kinase
MGDILVLKFGGTSVANVERIENAADKIAAEIARGNKAAVVVSAMSGVTNQLVDYCRNISPLYDAREYDAVVASGENITAGLMALALQKRGIQSRSYQGWQVRIVSSDAHGKARILEIETGDMNARMERGEVPVVAGFQGVTPEQRITTLGRGGSDTTAVALAAALKADRCDIYTDVDGVYTTDPRIVPKARKIRKISYEEMLEMASLGAKVLQTRSVEMAMKQDVPVQVLSSLEAPIGSDLPGTLVTREEDIMEQEIVTGITYAGDEAKVMLMDIPDLPGMAAKIFGPLADANINVDMIVQNASADGKSADVTFTVSRGDLPRALEAIKSQPELAKVELRTSTKVAKVSVVGIGMRSHAGVAQTMFKALSEKGINIEVISTSEIKISVLISEDYTELAVRSLHSAYKLEKAKKLS